MVFHDPASVTPLRPAGPLLPVHSPPQQRLFFTHEKPLPSPPSKERNRNGIKQWWKRNRYRSKQGSTPGQAELGLGASLDTSTRTEVAGKEDAEVGERRSGRMRYDMDVLTKQLAAVDFGSGSGSGSGTAPMEPRVVSQYTPSDHKSPFVAPVFPPRPTTTIGLTHPAQPPYSYSEPSVTLPPLHSNSQSTSQSNKRPPARYALHVRSEEAGEGIHHSVSAPQLDAYSYPYPQPYPHLHSQTQVSSIGIGTSARPRSPENGPSYRSFTGPRTFYTPKGYVSTGNNSPVKTFEPDSRALERFPDIPTLNSDVTRRQDRNLAHVQGSQWLSTSTAARPEISQSLSYRNQEPSSRNDNSFSPSRAPINSNSIEQPRYASGAFKVPTTPTPSYRRLPSNNPALPPASTSTRATWTPGSSTASTPVGAKSPIVNDEEGVGMGAAVQCSGYTQRGKRCKKKVKAVAAYYAGRPASPALFNINPGISDCHQRHSNDYEKSARNDHYYGKRLTTSESSSGSQVSLSGTSGAEHDGQEVEKRFCNVHVGQICSPEGFYLRNEEGAGAGEGVGKRKWVEFDDYIPRDLEEQTKVLLRLTMESPLTSNESAGFIYAYELRDLGTDSLAYYKVGRTDNVPRRINEWKQQCASHRPTLRDIFPQRDARLTSSALPGAMSNQEERCMAVKRLERRPCPDCQTTHREIFAIPRDYQYSPPHRQGQGQHDQTRNARESVEYERVVRSVILRWQKFVDALPDRV